MMYHNKIAVAIKHNGKILRENKDIVRIPFGSEFSVLIKNLNRKRVKFTLHIDGTDVLDGEEIIVNANDEVEMKRFIRNGNMDKGNSFRFIERTKSIDDGPRGAKVDDGIVRVEFWFEKEQPEIRYWNRHYYHDDFNPPVYPYNPHVYPWEQFINDCSSSTGDVPLRSVYTSTDIKNTINNIATASATFAASTATSLNDAGITVPGSHIDQQFTPVYGFKSEVNSHVITLRIVGKIGAIEVSMPVTVKTKNICSTCSRTNKYNANFCSSCGTSLELI